ncbi:MAG TPA: cytochrome c [Bacteroidales bacterium]|nr:cytochrome c [Bacteroidales bacterium]
MNYISSNFKGVFAFFALVVALGTFSSCEKYSYNPPAVDRNAAWSLSKDIQPIFNSNCVSCHGGAVSPNLKEGQSYNTLTRGGYVKLPAESSRLYTKLNDPSHAARTTAAEKLKILYWIEQGAKNN